MSEFLLKPRIRFGQDALAVLDELPARNVLLVTDKAMVKFGLADRVTGPGASVASLSRSGMTWWRIRISPPSYAG
ncbi:aldehyde-alcohol dehydrogenase [Raoultella ornithinolytica]|nr:aldehyde-alcohol dehydrogenase [Raoultella ornithinolytica]